ncbi:hypothetical protein PS9374_07212 [Planomonospora sphaerica]|uniref:Uncharacterized protein n=1 Tax=Planomonospora sphaerica TaxID=161355 RepID=A0A161LZI8_9ACTN|nr:hypothetical protein PS9374_07212 [Planomonospora sphaerica]
MSVSRIRDSDADRFSMATFRLLIVCSNRFCTAPRPARVSDTVWMAVSSVSIAAWALVTFCAMVSPVVHSLEAVRPRVAESWLVMATLMRSAASSPFEPTWKVPL